MNWFQRHLNWTWYLAVLVLGIVIRILTETIANEALTTFVWIIGVIGAFLITLWLLKEKHRNWLYVFSIFIPLVGWIIVLALKNRSEVVDMVDGEVITRPRDIND